MSKTVVWINLPKFKFKKVKTPYPFERLAAHKMIEDEPFQKWTMWHAIVTKKSPYPNFAWLQKGNKIYDPRTKRIVSKAKFFQTYAPAYATSYTYSEVRQNMAAHRRYGMWFL